MQGWTKLLSRIKPARKKAYEGLKLCSIKKMKKNQLILQLKNFNDTFMRPNKKLSETKN